MPLNESKCDEVRKIVLSLLLSRKGTIAVSALDRDYYMVEKEHIPWKQFGYANLSEFLQSMPRYFQIEWKNGEQYVRGIASEKSKHVSVLVSRQRTSRHVTPHKSSRPSRYTPNMQYQRIRIPAEQLNTLAQYVMNYPNGISMQTALHMIRKELPYITLSMNDLKEQLRELSHQLYVNGQTIRPVKPNGSFKGTNRHYPPAVTSQNVRPPSQNKYGVPGDESDKNLSNENDSISANFIDERSRNSDRLNASFAESVATASCRPTLSNGNDNKHATMNDSMSSINAQRSKSSENSDVSSLISDKVKSRLKQLVQNKPDGIWCAELPHIYLREYKVPLHYTELGFNSVREYVAQLPDVFYLTQKHPNGDFIVYSTDKMPISERIGPKQERCESSEEYDTDDDQTAIPLVHSLSLCKKFVPENVMNYNECVDQIYVTNLYKQNRYINVYIVDVFTPTFFWIHLQENRERFHMLMDDLHKFYVAKHAAYAIPKIALRQGLNCACVYEGIWHRGIIKSVKQDFSVTVMFYDFGTLKTYPPEGVHFLHNLFSHLPAQAIPCGLHNVKPCVGDRWYRSTTNRFVDKVSEKLLNATIVSVESTKNAMLIRLNDVTQKDGIYINEWLVRERLAQYGKMINAVDMMNLMNYVVNDLNQISIYCYAEEKPDSSSKATSTEDLKKVEPSHHAAQQPLKSEFDDNVPSESFRKPFINISKETNPFLVDESTNADIISTSAKYLLMQLWHENVKLQTKLTSAFLRFLKCPPHNKAIFHSHLMFECKYNKLLKDIDKALAEHEIDDTDDIGASESLGTYDPNESLMVRLPLSFSLFPSYDIASPESPPPASSNHFSTNNDNHISNSAIIPNYSTNSFDCKTRPVHNARSYDACCVGNTEMCRTNRNQSDECCLRLSATSTPLPVIQNDCETRTVFDFPCADQVNKKVFSMKSIAQNTAVFNIDRSSSNFLCNANAEVAKVCSQCRNENPPLRKETNPFRLSMAGEIQISETGNEYMNRSMSYPSVRNSQSQYRLSKIEGTNCNIHTTNTADYSFCEKYDEVKNELHDGSAFAI